MRTLSVIVLSWNGVQLTRETLDSLARCRVPSPAKFSRRHRDTTVSSNCAGSVPMC